MESSPIKIETKDRKGEDFVSIIIGEDLSHTSTAAQERNRNRLLLCVTGSMGRSCSTGGKRKDYVWPVVDNISDNISRPGVSFSFSYRPNNGLNVIQHNMKRDSQHVE